MSMPTPNPSICPRCEGHGLVEDPPGTFEICSCIRSSDPPEPRLRRRALIGVTVGCFLFWLCLAGILVNFGF